MAGQRLRIRFTDGSERIVNTEYAHFCTGQGKVWEHIDSAGPNDVILFYDNICWIEVIAEDDSCADD